MDANQSLLNRLSMGAYALDPRLDGVDEMQSNEAENATHTRIDIKGIREAIARVEAEARATVAAENRVQVETRARNLAEERAETDVKAAQIAQQKIELEQAAIHSGKLRLEAEQQSNAAS
jgi:hypothetical protein